MSITDPARVYAAARAAGAKFPLLVVAQWAVESARGTALSGRENYFGLKGKGTLKTTDEFVNGKRITIEDQFIDFSSIEECITYLVDRWYKDFKGYRGANNEETLEAAARMLQAAGYATDPGYANKLISVSEQYKALESIVAATGTDTLVKLDDVPPNYRGLPHQIEALRELDASLTKEQREAFTKAWRSTTATPAPSSPPVNTFPLAVPYFYQRDSKTGHGERMCQSSAIAMRIEQIDPAIIGDDDSYLEIVQRFGDTVSQAAHQKALSSLGLSHRFRQDGTEDILCDLLDQGIAVPIGILHKGPIDAPTGGGHWVTLIGYDERFFHVHDPFGELNLIRGGYDLTGPADGRDQRYTRKNLMKRWLIASKSDGWLWDIRK